MARPPIAIEREEEYNVAYVRYSTQDDSAYGETISYADSQINIDVDAGGDLLGIEILSLGATELSALAEIAKKFDLDLTPLIGGSIPSVA